MRDFFGRDLNVVPLFSAHDAADIDLVRMEKAAGSLAAPSRLTDLDVLEGRENLAQALILRSDEF